MDVGTSINFREDEDKRRAQISDVVGVVLVERSRIFLSQSAKLIILVSDRIAALTLAEQRAIQSVSIAVDKLRSAAADGFGQHSAAVVVGVQRLNTLAVGLGKHRAVQVIGVAFGGVGCVLFGQNISELVVGIGGRAGGRGNGGAVLPTTGIHLGDIAGQIVGIGGVVSNGRTDGSLYRRQTVHAVIGVQHAVIVGGSSVGVCRSGTG